MPKELGGTGVGFLGHTLAYEALGQGCPSTALSFNMHASVVMPLLDSPEVSPQAKRHVADLVVNGKQLVAGNYSEATSTALLGERWLDTIIRRVDGGWQITGRKMFASMLAGSRLLPRAGATRHGDASDGRSLRADTARRARTQRDRQLGRDGHARHAQQLPGPRRMPARGRRRGLSVRRHQGVPAGRRAAGHGAPTPPFISAWRARPTTSWCASCARARFRAMPSRSPITPTSAGRWRS